MRLPRARHKMLEVSQILLVAFATWRTSLATYGLDGHTRAASKREVLQGFRFFWAQTGTLPVSLFWTTEGPLRQRQTWNVQNSPSLELLLRLEVVLIEAPSVGLPWSIRVPFQATRDSQ